MLSSCLEKNDIPGAKDWLRPLLQNLNSPVSFPSRSFTGHGLPDAVISRYIEQAHESDIEITVQVVGIEQSKIEMTELAVVLANALENAVRACKMIEDAPKIIRVNGRQSGAQFFLEIANTYTGEVYISPDTGLPTGPVADDGKEHGLGSQSIAFFAEKHGAVLQYHIENGWFRLRLLV
jgi:sensor histidine kinase regulating citrate/malate metabolism